MLPMYTINIKQQFPQDIETVFSALSDHERFGEIIGAKIERIAVSQSEYQNGIGSVRLIRPTGAGAFEETVTRFEPNAIIEYRVTKGSPIKDHLGRLEFRCNERGHTELDYTIWFRPKTPIPGWGSLLSWIIRNPIRKGLAQFAEQGS